ncbi:Lrp/AsnC family transcriptional regulator [Hahella sp. KA22]|uniref:siroheme decarboxylase subunit beta n=1 Tax=Hahella sp. KA22 TaxID=1628392 RepID=UPI000FDF2AA8|nr:Lrp/AsnC family transcriptional regulator [Hahella sp. KA22]AZZ93290.1 Lrp/AsnC family transcriptional regulator [Hahella sp. KA22]QAY56665.1 Lrp/AsnC family transcriptional regulator [Hahella sp. KA22]
MQLILSPPPDQASAQERLRVALQDGIPLSPRPYLTLAQQCGLSEQEVIEVLQTWEQSHLTRRFGVVINHHKIGYTSNAMVVWEVADSEVNRLGAAISRTGLVSLCYQRKPDGPDWPYNLYCMLHGKSREEVLQRMDRLKAQCGLQETPCAVLFSLRQYKQCGGRYAHTKPPVSVKEVL